MMLRTFLVATLLLVSVVLSGQEGGVISPATAKSKPAITLPPLSTTFKLTKCGLTYTQASAKLAVRNDGTQFPAVMQPASLTISNIPPTATIEKAYLWWVVEKQTGGSSSVTLQKPAGPSQTFAGTLIGSDSGGKCWGTGSSTSGWRADVTSFITSPYNGVYKVSGLPVAPLSAILPDTDGVTLFIAYSIPGTGQSGTLVVNDGLIVTQGIPVTQQIGGFQSSCQDPGARSFMLLSDFQQNGSTLSFNSGAATTFNEEFWDWEEQTTTVAAGQSTSTSQINPIGDCVAWQVHGISYRCADATCKPCQQVTINARKQYAAKFVCYRVPSENPLQVVRGVYGTTLNVHNPAICPQHPFENPDDPPHDLLIKCPPVRFAKKVAVALPGQKPGKISNFRLASLKVDEAFQIDCADILSIAGVPPGSFLEGFVVIDSEGPLDVTAVYTARPLSGQVSTIDVEDVRERDVNAVVTFCQ